MKTLDYKRVTRYFGYILLVAVLFSCETKQYPHSMTKSKFELLMVTYKKAWVDGANASTNSQNSIGYFNDSIAKIKFKKDSLSFVGILYVN